MSRNIRTLGDFRNEAFQPDSGEESEGDEGRQGFYVGGSENSGQQVLGGPRNRDRDIRDEVFQAARRAGAEALSPEEDAEPRSGSFSGGGIRLGRPGDPTETSATSATGSNNEKNIVTVRMNMWEDGFSLDDGPLRNMEAPENQQFLREIMMGHIPRELAQAYPRQEIDLRMEKRDSPYVPPKAKPFEGTGIRLGGIVPNVVSNDAPQMSQKESEDAITAAQAEVKLDTSAPMTQIQIRLQNGKRLIGKFNHNHTVSVVRNFIVTAQPDLAFSSFQLMTTYPNKVIEDENSSLADCGLLNAMIAVKPVN